MTGKDVSSRQNTMISILCALTFQTARTNLRDSITGVFSIRQLKNISADEKKPVLFCGDLNVAHKEIDIKNPKTNVGNAGFTPQEREDFTRLLSRGFSDSFRVLYPDVVKYSWWSYKFRAREKNTGWRIDYFVVSDRFMERIKDAVILNEVMGSDHCPVGVIL